ncbi:MAG: DUF2975 domain-containing protein [Propionibacteriaceae bacterium]|nr:DUF2975 domain-containing protein [Propionibacteriaceae bacterium]
MLTTRLPQGLIILLMALVAPIQIVLLPSMSREMARAAPEFAHLRWPLLALSETMLLLADVVLVAVLGLLGLVARQILFSGRSVGWVDLLRGAIWAEAACLVIWLAVLWFATGGPPAATIAAALGLLAAVTVALVVTALKALLLRATAQSDELAGVI